MRTTYQNRRRFISSRLARTFLFAIAILLPLLSIARPCVFAGTPAPTNPITQFLHPPQNVYVLAIGINHYKVFDLTSSVSDATAVSDSSARTFKNSSVHVVRLTEADATKAKIREAIQQFALNSHASDLFILSFSGFTFTKSKNGNAEIYIAPSDAAMSDNCRDPECVDDSTLISGALLNSWMMQMHAQRQIILLDMPDTDKLIPIFEDHWRKESCSVGPEASKRLLIVTNHGGEDEDIRDLLTWSFLKQLELQHDKGIKSAFRLQQGLYETFDQTAIDQPGLGDRGQATRQRVGWGFRAELLGGDFLIDGPPAGVKPADLLRDSGLGALCYSDPASASRGLNPEEEKPEDDAAAQSSKPTNYALIIASDHYKNWNALSNPISDAATIEKDLAETYGFKVEHLWDPTRNQLKQKLDEYHHKTFKHGDQLFLFIAGHGDYDETNDIGYLVFPDTPAGHSYDSELNLQELRSRVDTIPVDHTFLVMDSCFAGSLDPSLGGAGRGEYDPIPLAALEKRADTKKTRYFLTSGGKEYVPDGRPGSHSPFAALFILALEKGTKTTGYLNIAQITPYFQRLATIPRAGNLGHNEDGADFFFVPTATPPPAVP